MWICLIELYGMFYICIYLCTSIYLNTAVLIVGTRDLSYIYLIITVLRQWIEKSRFSKFHVIEFKTKFNLFKRNKDFHLRNKWSNLCAKCINIESFCKWQSQEAWWLTPIVSPSKLQITCMYSFQISNLYTGSNFCVKN